MAEELTLSIDIETGEYTRLTRFYPGTDPNSFGSKSHAYPEEILIVSGRLYDLAFDMWIKTGHYALIDGQKFLRPDMCVGGKLDSVSF